ncbi:nitrite reductase large subunit NirB [Cytobacillus sp. IB215316]|uniref:nitrite reductase large subunit NirB n=1 Tax=Cytobacillus sp. IB215316 TaxID=3097354 RepID=UPI002A13719F|nr:nitrite reductase large subunit NirB [Cytobacillus sp. IB215316]MDX8359732.1 nitrite reductase large subunit NirB [Cytobacillus sp. IB215316]
MKKKKLVLIGNGMAGVRCIEEVIKLNPNQFEITVIGEEPHPNYNRILLSTVLAGDTSLEDITINDWQWYKENNIELFTGQKVQEINTATKSVITDKFIEINYDELIIATGSVPFILPLPGADKEGVTAFRDIKDCERMINASKNYKKAAVIGGGLLGLEAARGLLNLGMEVDVIHIEKYLMERQLDPKASKLLEEELTKQGMNFLLEKQTKEIIGGDRVEGLRFADGTEITADLVVMAVGIRPNVELAKISGIETNRGIVVNDYMQTSIPHVYAVGECAEHREVAYGLVAPLYEQGQVLANKLHELDDKKYEGSVVSTKLKVSGVDVFSAGEFQEDVNDKSMQIYDEYNNIYKKVVIRDSKVVGAVLYGDINDGTKLLQMMQKQTLISEMAPLSFVQGQSNGSGEQSIVASMEMDDQVCGCNGITKGMIVEAIKSNGLSSVSEVKSCTKAGTSCGGCSPLVSELVKETLGESFEETEQIQSICECTSLSRDEIVENIRMMGLTHIREVMNVLGWQSDEGCSKCRPAINYYLGMVHPTEYVDELESRFVNERMHANIQKDGTYSVVPRMYGGVTNAEELRRIADVAEKYEVPMVKLTGGQRIDLLGIKKEDLPKVWEELDMPSGYAYGKAIRTVKTCVGSEFCRFGTQNSTQMGIDLEKKFERLNTPAKVKMSVSACPRNCAESAIKDIGIVGVSDGWELYIGGNGGTNLRAGDLLCKVKTADEVIQWSGAILQYYRETGEYGERTSAWVERVGLTAIGDVLASEEVRSSLNERIEVALATLKDPWKDVVNDEDKQHKLYNSYSLTTV